MSDLLEFDRRLMLQLMALLPGAALTFQDNLHQIWEGAG